MYEMLLYWHTTRQPMITQKLGFKVLGGLVKAFAEAQSIMCLLVSIGNYKEKDVTLSAVAATGAMQKHFFDNKITLKEAKTEMAKRVKEIKALKLKQPLKNDKELSNGPMKVRGNRSK